SGKALCSPFLRQAFGIRFRWLTSFCYMSHLRRILIISQRAILCRFRKGPKRFLTVCLGQQNKLLAQLCRTGRDGAASRIRRSCHPNRRSALLSRLYIASSGEDIVNANEAYRRSTLRWSSFARVGDLTC